MNTADVLTVLRSCCTYPARPVNGGPLPLALPKTGDWAYEPKYNGWRALIHIPSGTMFSRKGQFLSISSEFKPALELLRSALDIVWADVEALERRHNIGRGCLVVLDTLPVPTQAAMTYMDRRLLLEEALPELDLSPPLGCGRFPFISIPPSFPAADAFAVWKDLQSVNRALSTPNAPIPLYEGLVTKRIDSKYPIQLRSPDQKFPFWMKHRWQF